MRVRTALTRRQPASTRALGGRTVASSLVTGPVTCLERCLVADLLYAVLLIGVFVVLALALRGLEKL
ncbi:hypothetical protein ACIA5G_27785 [Amycolatopsis sp. NPDC051758]|uniref:hypothetical protein n=1 Tax=Amycolatopsis sp. NPDC051758 TaxID=3363935 RepID=UPI0037A2FA7F